MAQWPMRDVGTARHSQTVGRYAEEIARALGLPEPHTQFDPQVVEAFLTVLTHDRKTRGRIGVRVA